MLTGRLVVLCSPPPVFQPFLSRGDSNWYAMVSGESLDNFAGTGWTLSGGAKITTQVLADGTTGLVLDMPSGSTAVSPEMCIGDGYPIAKPLIATGAEARAASRLRPATSPLGQSSARCSCPAAIMQFTYVAGGKDSDFQIYDFGVDPRMRC